MLHASNFKSLTVHVCVNDKAICVVYLLKFHTPLTSNRKNNKYVYKRKQVSS